MDGFSAAVLRRLVVAEAVITLLGYVSEDKFIERLFERSRGRGYHRVLAFSVLVRLVFDSLIQHEGSLHQTLVRRQEQDDLEVTMAAVYGKLRRLPTAVSEHLLRAVAARLQLVLPAQQEDPLPASFAQRQVLVCDGKTIKNVAKRLKATRELGSGRLLGGKCLCAYDARQGLVLAMATDLDGERNDCSLVADLVEQLTPDSKCRPIFVLDAQFCDLKQPQRYRQLNGNFVVRYHPKVAFHAESGRAAAHTQDSQGRNVCEDFGWLGTPHTAEAIPVRRMIVQRPGEEDLVVVTDLLDDEIYPAADVLDLYFHRWHIEEVFQKISEIFSLLHLISHSPRATIFQMALCTVLYNVFQVLCAIMAADHKIATKDVSKHNLFYDARRQLAAADDLLSISAVDPILPIPPTAQDAQRQLSESLRRGWTKRWIKAMNKPRKKRLAKPPIPGGHTSVHRAQQAANAAKPGTKDV